MLKFLVILLRLHLYTSPFTAVILPNFCYPNKNIFGISFLQNSCWIFCRIMPAGSPPRRVLQRVGKIELQFRPRLWTALSLLSGTSFELISWCPRWTTYLPLSRRTIGDISTDVLVWCTPDWSSCSTPTWKWCRTMITEWCFSPPLQAISSLLILRSSVTSSESQCLRFWPVHTMRWCFLHPWMISGNSSMPSLTARSALLPLGLVICLPPTACWPRSFSRTSGMLLGAVI
jgi:hypothetical protein